jgi:hypothetical protein
MEIVVNILKYIFVVGFGVEILLILRALFNLARDKAREAEAYPPAPPASGGIGGPVLEE